MKILLLSGGSGKRLWPLSNQIRSKQFLKLLSTKNNKYESMLQRVCRHLDSVGLLSSTSIITCQDQVDMIYNQLENKVPLIIEPVQKGTFSAISLAITSFNSLPKTNVEDLVCVLPVDTFAEVSFYHLLKRIPHILQKSQADLAHLGVEPQFPSDQFGYIVPDRNTNKTDDNYQISHFIEKPSTNIALQLIKKNALWNCGVYVFSIRYMIQFLKHLSFPTDYDQMLKIYRELPDVSFDQMVAQQSKRSIVIPYQGQWDDIGTWGALSRHMKSHEIGPCKLSQDSVNTHIINELHQPICVIGISDSMVVAGPDGILVAPKKRSSDVKKFITDEPPRYVEKRWGNYRVLEKSITNEGKQSITKMINILPGCNISYQWHKERQEIWTIVSGTGEFILNNQLTSIKAGDVLQIAQGSKHAVKAVTPLQIIEVQLGSLLSEEDITRITYSWEEAVQLCN
ncbi:sugar phosphate nucleotidyltransferase [Fictibacillus sp. UD]|uniref:sugar phosphate nucleotidyltransferase n=1 Tax=Fictibacillus sp. UD TaxID=3038777 RepID=UPI0037459FC9